MKVIWDVIKKAAIKALHIKGLNGIYIDRLKFEIEQVQSQGSERYFEEMLNNNKKFDKNPNHLLLPWLLKRLTGDADCDPIANADGPVVCSSSYGDIQKIIKETGKLPSDIRQDDDKPDIDIDCLPEARNKIKEYAARRYGEKNVASVGTWQTYLFKQALGDAYIALGLDKLEGGNQRGTGVKNRMIDLTKTLPDEVNEMREGGFGSCKGRVRDDDGVEKECGCKHKELQCPKCGGGDTDTPTIAMVLRDHPDIGKFVAENPEQHQHVIDVAVRLVGRIKHAGKHAGGIIIADRDLFGNVPMQYDAKTDQWVSVWTEGRNTQLSKFGYLKWDMLGLKNLAYIKTCCEMIRENHNISFGDRLEGWEESDDELDIAGYCWKDGAKVRIPLNDSAALKLANDSLTESIFQFDTSLAQSTLRNGVRNFHDLMAMSALGHPGPMQMIPEYVKRRDDPNKEWLDQEIPEIAKLLESTHGIVIYQEQFTSLLQRIAGFTGPEAQDARKSVAKKWVEKLKPVRQKWIVGAQKYMSESKAIEWYDEILLPFGRYCFNLSHCLAYTLWAYRCLWLKAHFPEEWWASVMGLCDQKALERYMTAARSEGIRFGEIDIVKLTSRPVAHSGPDLAVKQVALGLTSLKKVGDSMAVAFVDATGNNAYSDIDDFISRKGKSKIVYERLIKLGAFAGLHSNIRATWMWYLHEYGSGSVEEFEFADVDEEAKREITKSRKQQLELKPKLKSFSFPTKILRNYHLRRLLAEDGWTEATIEAERARQIAEYKRQFPKRNKIPAKLLNWQPNPKATRERIMALYPVDYELRQILTFEKEFLGYYWHSPCDLYQTSGNHTVDKAKINDCLEGVIMDVVQAMTKKGSDMLRVVVTDGRKECLVLVWEQDIKRQKGRLLRKDQGVRIKVDYNPDRNSFVLKRGSVIEPLWSKKAWLSLQSEIE